MIVVIVLGSVRISLAVTFALPVFVRPHGRRGENQGACQNEHRQPVFPHSIAAFNFEGR
jgi:hypothetical protein